MTYNEFKEKFNLSSDTLTSYSWSLGGNWRDCWGNEGSVTPEAQPLSFDEFDHLIERICPNLSFIQYKNIFNRCVTTDSKAEHDYYGGCSYEGYYECNLRSLYDELIERNLIEE